MRRSTSAISASKAIGKSAAFDRRSVTPSSDDASSTSASRAGLRGPRPRHGACRHPRAALEEHRPLVGGRRGEARLQAAARPGHHARVGHLRWIVTMWRIERRGVARGAEHFGGGGVGVVAHRQREHEGGDARLVPLQPPFVERSPRVARDGPLHPLRRLRRAPDEPRQERVPRRRGRLPERRGAEVALVAPEAHAGEQPGRRYPVVERARQGQIEHAQLQLIAGPERQTHILTPRAHGGASFGGGHACPLAVWLWKSKPRAASVAREVSAVYTS